MEIVDDQCDQIWRNFDTLVKITITWPLLGLVVKGGDL